MLIYMVFMFFNYFSRKRLWVGLNWKFIKTNKRLSLNSTCSSTIEEIAFFLLKVIGTLIVVSVDFGSFSCLLNYINNKTILNEDIGDCEDSYLFSSVNILSLHTFHKFLKFFNFKLSHILLNQQLWFAMSTVSYNAKITDFSIKVASKLTKSINRCSRNRNIYS